jgi:hypothetical protein
MARISLLALAAVTAALLLCVTPVVADEVDGCAQFVWDVSRELAVMKQTPQTITAGVKPDSQAPVLQLDKLYDLKLSGQGGVTYAVKPAKPTLNDSAQGGLVRFRVDKAGAYRVSITSGHWIDVVDGTQVIKSRDFTGARGCARPRKIVEFDLPAGKDLTLQLSGSTDPDVLVAITPVTGPATH